jgi:branched-chain amino acid transport system permease protein
MQIVMWQTARINQRYPVKLSVHDEAVCVDMSKTRFIDSSGLGVLIGLNYNAIQPYMGEVMMLKGFAVIILGGIGDIRGALIGGVLIGMLETLTAGYIASTWKDAVGFVVLVLTLWIRPSGLFGRLAAKRA